VTVRVLLLFDFRVLSRSTIHRAMESLCRSISGSSSCSRESFLLPSGSHGTSIYPPKNHLFLPQFFFFHSLSKFWVFLQLVASTNQGINSEEIPVFDLPPKILCRVLDVTLKVKLDHKC